jgi:lipid-A-disaccharide synthase
MKQQANPSLFIFSGEHSGDMHAAALISSLRAIIPEIKVSGVAGPCLRDESIDVLMNMEEFDVMGITDVIKAFPRLYKHFRKVRSHILKSDPDVTVLVDYQDFNLQLAKSLRKHGYRGKIIQYISPTVWAWRAGRADTLAKYFDSLFTIFPFEAKYFAHTALDVHYIGNPTKEKICKHPYAINWKAKFNLPNAPLIALFPGSRKSELSHNLPLHLKVAESLIKKDRDLTFAISCTNRSLIDPIFEKIKNTTLTIGENLFVIPRDYSYELMQDSQLALAKSGTVTLELALHNTPTVVTYEISKTHQFIGKHLLRLNLPYYCIVNILANKEVFPEFIGASLPDRTISETMDNIRNQKHQQVIDSCNGVNDLLTDAQPAPTAAAYIQEMINK